jgi:hypothetical protein
MLLTLFPVYKSAIKIIPIREITNLRKIPFLFFLFLFQCTVIFGQNIHEFKEIWIKESRDFLLNYQKPLPYLQSGFHHFSREQDNTLTEGLEADWEKFTVTSGLPVPKSRKFDPAPQFLFDETSYHNPQFLPCFTAEKDEEFIGFDNFNPPRIRKPEYISSNLQKQSFKYYGNSITINYDRLLSLPVSREADKELVIEFWKKFQVANTNHLIDQLMIYRDKLGLNDWGYFLLVKACSNSIYPTDESGATLLGWALMIRSGFRVKIGYNQLGISILYPTSSEIKGIPFVKINGIAYYIDKPIFSFPITICSREHPGATGIIRLKLSQSINFQGETLIRKIQFLWDKKTYEFSLKFNPEEIRFLEEYPKTDPEIYFNAPFSFLTGESLMRQFRPVLAGMRKEEAAAFLQQFVQKSFAYRPYNDLYGYDCFMFPEELLFKEESNDKGKSLLYAWMISNLLYQKAALVEFPGFYSVAISLDQPLEGDKFLLDGRSYTFADPTFENAPLGLVMKDFYQQKPYVRVLNNVSEELAEQEKIWKLAMAIGAERSGTGEDFIRDENGDSYITGFFREKKGTPVNANPAPFIAKFDEKNSLVWMEKFSSTGQAFGIALRQFDKNEFYLAGTFKGELGYNRLKIQSNPSDPDLFFAQFNKLGEVAWITKTGLDDLEEDTKLFYTARFSRSGEIKSVQLSNEDERTGKTGFQDNTNEGLCFVASRYQTSGLDRIPEEPGMKSTMLLRRNLNRMKQLGIEPKVAFLASVFNSLINPGNQLTGTDLVINRQDENKTGGIPANSISESAQKFKLIKNNEGIVEVLTTDSSSANFLSFKIMNHAKLKIIPLDNNDLKINIISGIEMDSGMARLKVNSMIIELSTGSILLDLGKNHHLISRNLSHEILK